MPRLSPTVLLSSLLLGLAAPTVPAQIYRWVDAEGRVHYSDQLPVGVAAERIEMPADRVAPAASPRAADAIPSAGARGASADTGTSGAAADAAAAAGPEAAAGPNAVPGAVSPRDAAAAAAVGRERSCQAARQQRVVLEIDRPVYREADGRLGVFWLAGTRPNYYEGERSDVGDAERRELLAAANTIIARDCDDPDDAAAQAVAEDLWFHDEDCRAMRAELASLRRPQMRTAESDLLRKQREADAFCAAVPAR